MLTGEKSLVSFSSADERFLVRYENRFFIKDNDTKTENFEEQNPHSCQERIPRFLALLGRFRGAGESE
ncbi:MAG: hypothetical protein IJN39_04725, partial [Clostridia bacterium]|nr:hypothetical protein [Clostridia bacterium]